MANQNIIRSDMTLKDLFDLYGRDIKLSLNCHEIARVESFNAAKQTVNCSISVLKSYVQRQANGTTGTITPKYPILVDCPAIVLSGGDYSLRMPIQAGDDCLILFNDRDMDNWLVSGQIQAPASNRLHSFTDGIALVGLRSFARSIAGYSATDCELGTSTRKLKISEDTVGIEKGSVKVELSASDKIKIENATRNLNTLLQQLIVNLQALTVTGVTVGSGSSGVPANAAAFATLGTQIGELLE